MKTILPKYLKLFLEASDILSRAIDLWKPSHIICLYSGGYDSLCATHVAHLCANSLGLPMLTYSIDTMLSADGWRDYVCKIGGGMGWRHDIYTNTSGFNEFVEWVKMEGCPYSPSGHERAYNRLKDRAINQMLQDHKLNYYDKVLFVSGIRKAESRERKKLEHPIQRAGKSNAIFANPLFYWSNADLWEYRINHNLPPNPFYDTVGGSGDCQCNWGRFISLEKLKRHSPVLAAGNVAKLDRISRDYHGYGWDGKVEGAADQLSFFDGNEGSGIFLCSNCSRKEKSSEAQESVILDRMQW